MDLGFQTESAKDTAELDPVAEFRQGVELLRDDYPQKALVSLQHAYESDKHNAYYSSFLGLAIARAQRKWDQATELCEIAVQLKPKELQFHLNLGEVYASSGRREKALDMLGAALELFGKDKRLMQARSKVENRRNPLVPFFGRKHFLNRELGKLWHRTLKRLGKDSNVR